MEVPTTPKERRAAARVDIDIPASLIADGRTSPCRALNICEKGFLIEAGAELPIGEHIELIVPLTSEAPVACTVQIRHVNKLRLGALVIDMSDEHRARCLDYLAERRAAKS